VFFCARVASRHGDPINGFPIPGSTAEYAFFGFGMLRGVACQGRRIAAGRTEQSMSDTMGEAFGEAGKSFCTVNPHCLENIVRLSDEMEVTASSDIYDDRGTKLWAKGAPVSRNLQEKMLRRRLREPLEVNLDIEHGASLESIVDDCFDLMKNNAALEVLGGTTVAKGMLRNVSNTMHLSGPLRLLLTSAREHKKRSYEISLAGMIICSGLAHGIGLNDHDAGLLILSALVHDIGEMYINPEYLDNSRQLQPTEWKHVASHPCVGQAFLKEFTSFPPSVADCVLHHHERLDGSGYPFQISGSSMSQLGKLICVADSASAIVMRGGAGLSERVAVALRIIPEEFPRAAVSVITKALAGLDDTVGSTESCSFSERVLPTLQQLRASRMLAEAIAHADGRITRRVAGVGQFALAAILSIDKSLRATGVYELSQLELLERDPAIMGEVCLVLSEVTWRLRNLARNIYLRTEQGGKPDDLEQIADLVTVLSEAPKSASFR
jgi:hypothetical protein